MSNSKEQQETNPATNYLGYQQLYVTAPALCGQNLMTIMLVITFLAGMIIACSPVDLIPLTLNLGYFWSSLILLCLDLA